MKRNLYESIRQINSVKLTLDLVYKFLKRLYCTNDILYCVPALVIMHTLVLVHQSNKLVSHSSTSLIHMQFKNVLEQEH